MNVVKIKIVEELTFLLWAEHTSQGDLAAKLAELLKESPLEHVAAFLATLKEGQHNAQFAEKVANCMAAFPDLEDAQKAHWDKVLKLLQAFPPFPWQKKLREHVQEAKQKPTKLTALNSVAPIPELQKARTESMSQQCGMCNGSFEFDELARGVAPKTCAKCRYLPDLPEHLWGHTIQSGTCRECNNYRYLSAEGVCIKTCFEKSTRDCKVCKRTFVNTKDDFNHDHCKRCFKAIQEKEARNHSSEPAQPVALVCSNCAVTFHTLGSVSEHSGLCGKCLRT